MRFVLSELLLQQLRDRRDERDVATLFDLEKSGHAFLLDPGLGPAVFLTDDGRVLVDEDESFDEPTVREATDDEATASLVVGAQKTGIAELLSLLPPRPPAASPCRRCEGSRWMTIGAHRVVCGECCGRGWSSA